MVRRLLAAAILPAMTMLPHGAAAAESARASSKPNPADYKTAVAAGPASETSARPRLYVSENMGFSIAVPPGAEVVERKGTNQISVRSRKGYVINLQVGPQRPDVPLARMSALLEAKYLGEGRPWSSRGDERPLRVAGLPAHDVVYRGTGSKARVVVARGAVNDYVFIFIAAERSFPKLETEFEWALKGFQPNKKDVRAQTAKAKAKAKAKVTANAKVTAAPMPVAARAGKRFAEPGYGYAIDYPVGWQVSKPSAMTAMFSGREGSADYAAIIGIQNIAPPGARDPGEAAKRAFNQLRASLGNAVRDLKVIEDQAWIYARPGVRLTGRALTVTYRHAGAAFQKRMIVVPRPVGSVAHVWSFTAPRAEFASLQPKADGMLKSWTILTDRRQ